MEIASSASSWTTEESTCGTKLLASLVLFLITLVCAYLPLRLVLNPNYVQHALFAGGGVLMATAFCHLMPEAHDNYKHSKVPYVEITLCSGFLFMYAIEQFMTKFIADHSHQTLCQQADNCKDQCETIRAAGASSQDCEICVIINDTSECPSKSHKETSQTSTAATEAKRLESNNNTDSTIDKKSAVETSEICRFAKGFVIVAAFGTHLLFDGVAIGSQETSEKVWTLFFAISCHKLIIAVVIGFELFAATLESHRWTLVNLIIFSIMSPLGIILIVIAQDALNISGEHPAMILLQSFATGTLLYIIFVEILQPKDPRPCEHQLSRIFSLILGFFLMLAVFILIDEEG